MRIGLICTTFLPSTGGIEWKVHHLATEYARRGHKVTVFASRPRLTVRPIELPLVPDYRVVRCGFPFPRIDRLGILELLYRRAILARHRRQPFDVLHTHHLGMPTRFGVSVKETTGVPVVATTCGADVMLLPEAGHGDRMRPHIDRVIRDNVRVVDIVGSINSEIHRELERLGATGRIVDIPNGVPWDLFQDGDDHMLHRLLGLDDSSFILLSVGRLRPVKGYELGIRAFARVARCFPDVTYVLVGQDIPGLSGLVQDLRLTGRVQLLGRRGFSEMPSIFRSADVFFSPSLMEGFSQVNVQAMASGLPCVISDAPGNADAAGAGGAVSAKAGDVESMAAALAEIFRDSTRRRQLAREAHEISRRFAWSLVAEQYLDVFNALSCDRAAK